MKFNFNFKTLSTSPRFTALFQHCKTNFVYFCNPIGHDINIRIVYNFRIIHSAADSITLVFLSTLLKSSPQENQIFHYLYKDCLAVNIVTIGPTVKGDAQY